MAEHRLVDGLADVTIDRQCQVDVAYASHSRLLLSLAKGGLTVDHRDASKQALVLLWYQIECHRATPPTEQYSCQLSDVTNAHKRVATSLQQVETDNISW